MVWTHVHDYLSAKDGLSSPEDNVARAKQLEFKALAQTNHGNMGGAVRFYLACRKAGIEPLLGIESYVALERSRPGKGRKREDTFHLTMLATNLTGYRNLVRLHNTASRNYYYKPIIDLGDLAQAAEQGGLDGVYGLSGCWFGLGPRMLREGKPLAVLGLLKALGGWFGSGFAIELMHHEISDDKHDDDKHVQLLHTVSERLGLPTVISQDSHYVHAKDRGDHDFYKWLTSWGNPDETSWPGELGYHMVGFDEVRHLYPDHIWDKAMVGMKELESMAHIRIPELEEYTLRVPDLGIAIDPFLELQRHCIEAMAKWSKPKRYWDRLEAEFKVIESSGFAPYLMLVKEICEELDRRGYVWSVRGSASGSMVCYLLGISQFDPLGWKLRFDRFLSTDRTKPPDIDIDMDPEYRDEMFSYLGSRWHTLRIGTWSKFKLRSEDDDDFEEGKQQGSLVVQYRYATGKILEGRYGNDHKKWPREAHEFWRAEIPADDWQKLRSLDRYKAYKNYSTHAAGLIITDDERVLDEIPQLAVSNKEYMVSAFDKDDVERLGLVKLDLLNLKLLTGIRVMQEVTGISHKEIPPNDQKVFGHINRGNITGLFQLEGGSISHQLHRLKPRKMEDLIAAVALFRPATMDSGATEDYLRRRARQVEIPVRHELIAKVTKDTYGILLYQEQAIEIFRELGMTIEEIEKARSAIKASNAGVHDAQRVLDELMIRVRDLAKIKGISAQDTNWLEHTLHTFSGYCVTGDTVIWKSSGGNHTPQTMTVKELHDIWHGPNTPTRKKYRAKAKGVSIMARDTSDGRIRPFRVKNVWCSGERKVWKVTLANGMSITSTGNHRHLTQYGWVETDDLTAEHQLAVMGEPERFSNYEFYVPKAIKERIRAEGQCRFCGRTDGRLEIAHLNHDRLDNSPENAVLLCNHCHKQHDWDTGRRQTRHSRGRPLTYSSVVSVVNAGKQMTYDLEMDSPDHSWVGNGIVTHNSFNRSHAVSYAVWAYKAAWYSLYHPVAFWTGMLNAHVENKDRVAKYLKAAREAGVHIRNPHVNSSGMNFTASSDGKFIFKGLRTIDGLGEKRAAEVVRHQPYSSLDDLALRTSNTLVSGSKNLALGVHPADCTGAVTLLHNAGALKGLSFEETT